MNLLPDGIMGYVALFVVVMLFTIPAIWAFFVSNALTGTLSCFLDNFLATRAVAKRRKEQNLIKSKADRYVPSEYYPLEAYLKVAYVLLPILLTSAFAYYEVSSLFTDEKTTEKSVKKYAGAEMAANYKTVFQNVVESVTASGMIPLTQNVSDREQSIAAPGKVLYETNCAACHQSNGKGLPGAFPPLADSEWVINAPETPVKILLHGMVGEMTVGTEKYNGVMAAWQNTFNDQELADLLSYVRTSFGNSASEIDAEFVEKIRKDNTLRANAWTAGELE